MYIYICALKNSNKNNRKKEKTQNNNLKANRTKCGHTLNQKKTQLYRYTTHADS